MKREQPVGRHVGRDAVRRAAPHDPGAHAAARMPARTPPRTAYKAEKHGRRRREVLDAAAATFRDKGFHAATMQDIADRLGMRAASLYHYLPSKEVALEAICRTTGAEFESRLGEIARRRAAAPELIRAGILMHLDPAWRDYVGAFAFYRRSLPPAGRAQLNAIARQYLATWERIIRRGEREGTLRSGMDPQLAAAGLVAMCNGIIGWFGHKSPAEIAAISEGLVGVLLHGLLKGR